MRIIFQKKHQKIFLRNVLKKMNCPSIKELKNRGIEATYSTLKNYFNNQNSLPFELFETLCFLSKVDKNKFNFEIVEDNFGQIKGGKKSKRRGFIF
jgi:hypothetical protein